MNKKQFAIMFGGITTSSLGLFSGLYLSTSSNLLQQVGALAVTVLASIQTYFTLNFVYTLQKQCRLSLTQNRTENDK